eukprot:TRINITY_DN23434_c0_g1_i1.p1 TRINITY_DN23434_c0_g1~~TRINITY_DN23434_c0_g1_i1.p1  ORF type:complete len:1381 (+),score=227.10 TRINITY_DN23434_c0_g1_i1:343-4143(+)
MDVARKWAPTKLPSLSSQRGGADFARGEDARGEDDDTDYVERQPSMQPAERLRRSMKWNADEHRMVWTVTDPDPGTRAAKVLERATGVPPSLWDSVGPNLKKNASLPNLGQTSSLLGAMSFDDSRKQSKNFSSTYGVGVGAFGGASLTPARSEGVGFAVGSPVRAAHSVRQAKSTKDVASAAAAKAMGLPTLKSPCKSVKHRLDASFCQRRYFKQCTDFGMAPSPEKFMTGHSFNLDAVGRNLTDSQVLAIACVLPTVERIDEVNLGDCSMVTDLSLVPLLSELHRRSEDETMHHLSLAGCSRASLASMHMIVRVVEDTSSLRTLNLSGVQLNTRIHLPLCLAVGQHPSLQSVDVSWTCLGSGNDQLELKCIDAFMSSKILKRINLSGNVIGKDTFTFLGKRLVENNSVDWLSLASCSSPAASDDAPITYFTEFLAYEDTLTDLDVGFNGINGQSAIVFEDALARSSNLKALDVSGNHLGVLGLRSFLRLLSNDFNGIENLFTDGCYLRGSGVAHTKTIFRLMNPSGRYKFDLSKPCDRSFLRMLYKITDDLCISPDVAFDKIISSEPPFTHATKNSDQVWIVPTSGIVSLTFSVDVGMEAMGVDDGDFSLLLSKYFAAVKAFPSFKKSTALCVKWREVMSNTMARSIFLEALSVDFNLNLYHLQYIVHSTRDTSVDVIWHLLPCVIGESGWTSDGAPTMSGLVSRSTSRNDFGSSKANRSARTNPAEACNYLAQMCCAHVPEFLSLRTHLVKYLDFNFDNPTGRYSLDLGNPAEHAIAEAIWLLDRWEAHCARRNGLADTSSRGDGALTRNELWQNRPLHSVVGRVSEWLVPEHDTLEFDYVSNQRPNPGAPILPDDSFDSFLNDIYKSKCAAADKILVLRSLSHHIHINSMQMRSMLGFFSSKTDRADVFVTFYLRIVDMHNSKIFTVAFDTPEDVEALMMRLGYVAFFPFIQPENLKFRLDFGANEQKVCAAMLVQLALKEKAGNLRDPIFVLPDGKVDPLPLGVPRSWEFLDKAPKGGIFSGYYVCAPEDRQFGHRMKLWDTYARFSSQVVNEHGGFRPLQEQDVMWWTGLTEAPQDIISLLEFFISRVPDIPTAFTMIDGVDGNGVITLMELREGLQEMGCTKFEGPNEAARIEAIFRHLDPGGEGSVSKEEWGILEQLWNEFDLSIRDFTQFLVRTFNDDLNLAWFRIDEDGSGELTEDEFISAVSELGYFGPSRVVFKLLDSSDDGTISFDEFEVLTKYKGKADLARHSISSIEDCEAD